MRKKESLSTKEEIFAYLIAPSHLFLKQVVAVTETKEYILIQDLTTLKQRSIPTTVQQEFNVRLQHLRLRSSKSNEYDGVTYILIPKATR